MKFKKIVAITLATMLTFAVVGCSSDTSTTTESTTETTTTTEATTETVETPEETADQPEETAEAFVVGTSADYPPYEFKMTIDGKDEFVGFDIELAKAIAEELGRELEIVDMPFDSLLLELNLDKVDMVISGLSPTEERLEQVDMSDLYYEATHGVIVHVDDADTLVDIASLAGKTVGVQTGSIQEEMAIEQMTESEIVSLDRIPNLILELKSGKVDALVVEKPVAETYLTNNEELAITFEMTDDGGGSAVAVAKGNEELLEAANKVIAEVLADGTFDAWLVEANELASN